MQLDDQCLFTTLILSEHIVCHYSIGNSWADKVKGKSPPHGLIVTPLQPTNLTQNTETEVQQQIMQEHLIVEKEFFKEESRIIEEG